VLFLTISETVKLYGVELGTDKIAHIFQQGYTYYRMAERARAKAAPPTEATGKAVRWGKMTEKTFYGYWVSGVYSNADLAANFAGLKFYENLTRAVRVGERTHEPLLVLKEGFWKFNENVEARENLLKPFISNHLNEALNPSHYVGLLGFRSNIRKAVVKHACPQWRALYADRRQLAALTKDLNQWHGEDYGYKDSQDFITIAGTCY
jgi:hypothetical protein